MTSQSPPSWRSLYGVDSIARVSRAMTGTAASMSCCSARSSLADGAGTPVAFVPRYVLTSGRLTRATSSPLSRAGDVVEAAEGQPDQRVAFACQALHLGRVLRRRRRGDGQVDGIGVERRLCALLQGCGVLRDGW